MNAVILGLLFIGLLMALLTPFLKTGVIVTFASFVGYLYIVDVESWLPIFLLLIGLLLVVLEVFIPDFGILGVIGIAFVVGGLYITSDSLFEAVSDLAVALTMTIVITYFFFKNGYISNRWEQFILEREDSNGEIEKKETHFYIGQIGIATTPLRPSGNAEFQMEENGETEFIERDVITRGGHVNRGEQIEIMDIQGNKIIVRRVK